MNHFFFSNLSNYAVFKIFSYLSPKELYDRCCEPLDRKQQREAELVLLAKNDEKYSLYQLLLLKKLAHRDLKKIDKIYRIQLIPFLNKFLLKTKLTFQERFSILITFSRIISAQNPKFEEKLINRVNQGLKTFKTANIEHFLQCCKNILPFFDKDQFKLFIDLAINKLNSEGDNRKGAIECLIPLTPYLNKEQIQKIAKNLISRSLNQGILFVKDETKCLVSFAPYLQSYGELQPLMKLVLESTNSSDIPSYTRTNLTHYLNIFSKYLSIEELQPLLKANVDKLSHKEYEIRVQMINFFEGTAPNLNKDQLLFFSNLIKEKLNDSHWKVRKAAVNCLSNFLSFISPEVQNFFLVLVEKLEDPSPFVQFDTIISLSYLYTYFTFEQSNFLICLIRKKLSHEEVNIRLAALRFFKETFPQISPNFQEMLVSSIAERLFDLNFYVSEVAKETLNLSFAYLNTSQLDLLVEKLKQELIQVSTKDRKEAIDSLKIFSCKLGLTQLQSLADLMISDIIQNDFESHVAAINCLAKIIPSLPLEKIQDLTNILLKTDQNSYNSAPGKALCCLASFLPSLNETVINRLAIALTEKSIYTYSSISKNIDNFIFKLNSGSLFLLAQKIIKLLDNGTEDVKYTAIERLASFSKRLDINQNHHVLKHIKEKLNASSYIQGAVLEYLPHFFYSLYANEKNEIGTILIKKLKNEEIYIQEKALICLTALIPYLTEDQLLSLAKLTVDKLIFHRLEDDASQCLITLLPHLNKEKTHIIINDLINQFPLKNRDAQKSLIDCFRLFAPYLSKELTLQLVNLVIPKIQDNYFSIRDASLNCLSVLLVRTDVKPLQDLLINYKNKNLFYSESVLITIFTDLLLTTKSFYKEEKSQSKIKKHLLCEELNQNLPKLCNELVNDSTNLISSPQI